MDLRLITSTFYESLLVLASEVLNVFQDLRQIELEIKFAVDSFVIAVTAL